MKQIEIDMITAIAQRGDIDWKQANTRVVCAGAITEVWLHGNKIARRDAQDAQDSAWRFNLCGWNTPTTRSRINAIASAHNIPGVFTKAGKPLRAGVAVPDNGWF